MKRFILFGTILLASIFLTACPQKNSNSSTTNTASSSGTIETKKPKVVVTIGMVADVTRTIGNECIKVTAIMGPGIDPHLYTASANDVRLFQQADMIFYSGYHLEGKLAEVLEKMSESRPVIAVAENAIPASQIINSFQGKTAPDPHVWMDVSQWAATVDVISKELSRLAPDCKTKFEENAISYKKELTALHKWIKESIQTIPENQRILVTAHDAFEYYGRAYTIRVDGIQGISTASEAGLADIRKVVELVVDHKVPALFVETSINPRTIKAVQAAVQDRGFDITIGNQLFSDAMGTDGTASGTYIGMLYNNTKNISDALGGKTPKLPAELSDWEEKWQIN